MKNILIPTDFSLQSVNIVHPILNMQPQQNVRIHLVHLLHMPTDIMDLMFLKEYRRQQQVPGAFMRAVQQVREMYTGRIASIGLEFYYGNRASVLHSIIENRQIDAICVVKDHAYTLPLEDSVDMMPLVERCKVPLYRIPVTGKVAIKGETGKAPATLLKRDYITAM